jgi:hypothetical protein
VHAVVVSSLTPRMALAIDVQRPGFALQLRAELVEDDAPLLGILVRVERRHLAAFSN